jgi:hypothetical protein
MKLFLLCCALLLANSVVLSEEVASRLIQPMGSSLKLVELKNAEELRAEFSGTAWIEGTLFGEWTEGSYRIENAVPEYTLVPNTASKVRLPHFVINAPPYLNSYKVKSIEIENGSEALQLAIGRVATQRFIERKRGLVRVTGRFQLESFSVGVECDVAWAKAKV